MTNEEILRKAIEKAVKNGYEILKYYEIDLKYWDRLKPEYAQAIIRGVIFSHDFAKAFWGKEMVERWITTRTIPDIGEKTLLMKVSNWEFHLQRMVKESNPLKYLERFLE